MSRVQRRRPTQFWVLVSVSVLAALTVARSALNVTHGLRAEYFADERRSDTPTLTIVDSTVSTRQIADDWLDPPPTFRARWFGFLIVGRSGPYTFATASDDGSLLTIDGHLVVDNGGIHTVVTRSGSIWLDRGPHAV